MRAPRPVRKRQLRWRDLVTQKASAALLLLFTIACATPAPKQTSTTPPSNLPQMAGAWTGSMVFTTVTGNVTFNLTEDASGNLTGNAARRFWEGLRQRHVLRRNR